MMQTFAQNDVIVMNNELKKEAFALELELAASQPPLLPNAIDLLEKQLNDVYMGLQPTRQDYDAREATINFLNDLVRNKLSVGNILEQYGVCAVSAFGSYTMNMFTSTSDLDISLNLPSGVGLTNRNQGIQLLKKLTKLLYKLKASGIVQDIQPILKAKVPVVKFLHCNTGIECDISVENRDGMMKSEFMRICSHIDPRFRKLCFLVKAWANASGINSSKDHTLNSLSIILLVAFHLQTRVPAILPPFSAILKDYNSSTSDGISMVERQARRLEGFGIYNKDTVTQLFNSFLIQIIAVKNIWQEGLCASTYQGTWMKASEPDLIFVQDFSALSQNAARVVNQGGFHSIYKSFQEAHVYLRRFVMSPYKSPSLRSLLFTPEKSSQCSKKELLKEVRREPPMQREKHFNHNIRQEKGVPGERMVDELALWLTYGNARTKPNPQMTREHLMAEALHSSEHPSKYLKLAGDRHLNSLLHPRYQGLVPQEHPSQNDIDSVQRQNPLPHPRYKGILPQEHLSQNDIDSMHRQNPLPHPRYKGILPQEHPSQNDIDSMRRWNSLPHPRYQGILPQEHPSQNDIDSMHQRSFYGPHQPSYHNEGPTATVNSVNVRREANGLYRRERESSAQTYYNHPFGRRMY